MVKPIVLGTELHRVHRSANMDEAKNYAAAVAIWEQLFGTYRLPAAPPEKLGVVDRDS